MKVKVTDNEIIKNRVRTALKENDFYCPCVVDSKGKAKYLCMCQDFRENTKVGETCFCGLYTKTEE